MPHGRGRFPQVRSQRRSTAWSEGPGGTALTTFTSSSPQFIGAFVVPVVPGLTVIRIRGRVQAFLTAVSIASSGFRGAFGIGIATIAAINGGIGSVPTPLTEQGSENWLYWRAIQVHGVTATIADGANAMSVVDSFDVDTKAMRKNPEEFGIYAAAEFIETGAATLSLAFDSRLLDKLP